MLVNLSLIIDKARIHAETRRIKESVLINARLAPEMYPLCRQIQIVTDMARTCTARLAGVKAPFYAQNETTFSEFKTRIDKTIAFLQSIDRELINKSHDQIITFALEEKEVVYVAQDYLLANIIPHFNFHVTTAYAILRNQGVELGKKDYLDNE